MEKMTNKRGILLLWLMQVLLITSCDRCTRTSCPTQCIYTRQVVIVLCDFTTSIDSSVADVKKNIEDAIYALPPNTEYYFYQIDDGISRPFIQGTVPCEENNRQYLLDVFGDNKLLVDSLYRSNKSNFTCIKTVLESVESKMGTYLLDTSYTKVTLLILSDMLEYCEWTKGKVNLEKNRFSEANSILAQEKVSPLADNTEKLKIGVILSTGRTIQYADIRSFWNAYFKQAGFDKEVLWDMSISPEFFKH